MIYDIKIFVFLCNNISILTLLIKTFEKEEIKMDARNSQNSPKSSNSLKDEETSFHKTQKDIYNSKYNQSENYNHAKSKPFSIQDAFLNNCRHEKIEVSVSLTNSTNESGIIIGFDSNVIILANGNGCQFMIMKSGIIIIKPVKSVNYIFNDLYKSNNYYNSICNYSDNTNTEIYKLSDNYYNNHNKPTKENINNNYQC